MTKLFTEGTADPNSEALEVLNRELTANARSALAHLLNNALCIVTCEATMPTIDRQCLEDAVNNLRLLVRTILRGSVTDPISLETPFSSRVL